jgi:ribosomal protein S18 acetylase RimI-like enzyme
VARLGAVERAAGRIFATVGMADVAAHEPLPPAELAGYQHDGRAWVAVDGDDRPVAYVLVDVVDGGAHIEQLSVHPDAGRQGIGARLVDTVAEWAVASGSGRDEDGARKGAPSSEPGWAAGTRPSL